MSLYTLNLIFIYLFIYLIFYFKFGLIGKIIINMKSKKKKKKKKNYFIYILAEYISVLKFMCEYGVILVFLQVDGFKYQICIYFF